jgi:citrate/tricarballylate utilization protein
MQPLELIRHGQHVMTVCNACRYCEQYCPVFPAMERRLTFGEADLEYLANLCHNCGECLYACQYAPPHEFGINVPAALAAIRLEAYEKYCWPRALRGMFRRQSMVAALAVAAGSIALMFAAVAALRGGAMRDGNARGDFYAVVPHAAMVALFGAVGLWIAIALAIGLVRFWRDIHADSQAAASAASLGRGLRDALTLRHLHTSGVDCTSQEEERSPWRRYWHHVTFYGFALCFASTSVAAVYHGVFGWLAPYPLSSLPVILGTLGGIGLVIGPAGLFALRRARDPALTVPGHAALDESFIVLLFLTSATGLVLLALRDSAWMSPLLLVHLGVVLALFVTLPYGKFVHGFYRAAALVKYAIDRVAQPPT